MSVVPGRGPRPRSEFIITEIGYCEGPNPAGTGNRVLIERVADHRGQIADQPIGYAPGDRQLVSALKFLNRRSSGIVENARWLDLAVAILGQRGCTTAIRGDGSIRSAIGSLCLTAAGCGATAATTGRAGTDGATGLGISFADCSDFGLVKNGAGCDPDCRNTAFVMMSRLAAAATARQRNPLAAPSPWPIAASQRAAGAGCACVKRRIGNAALRHFSSPQCWTAATKLARNGVRRMRRGLVRKVFITSTAGWQRSLAEPHPLAIERQPDGHARTLAEPAAD